MLCFVVILTINFGFVEASETKPEKALENLFLAIRFNNQSPAAATMKEKESLGQTLRALEVITPEENEKAKEFVDDSVRRCLFGCLNFLLTKLQHPAAA